MILLDGRVVADSLVGRVDEYPWGATVPVSRRCAVAVADVREARTLQHSHEKSVLFLVGIVAVGFLGFYWFIGSQVGS